MADTGRKMHPSLLCSKHIPTLLPNDPLSKPKGPRSLPQTQEADLRTQAYVEGLPEFGPWQACSLRPQPRLGHGPKPAGTQRCTAHYRMGNGDSEGAERTQAGGPRSFLGEVTIELGPKGGMRFGWSCAPGRVDRRDKRHEGERSK